ncbi:MAG: hypothetical protein ACKO1U_02095, partial [Bacteroidota bacterium]
MTPGINNRNPKRLGYLGDTDFFSELVCAHLKMIGNIQVDHTTSCDELLKRLSSIDLLVVEEGVRDCNLDELLTVLKLRSAETPCIILSSNVTSESKLRLLQLGANDVIARDEFTCEVLEVQIRRAMESLTLSDQLNAARKRLEGVSIS